MKYTIIALALMTTPVIAQDTPSNDFCAWTSEMGRAIAEMRDQLEPRQTFDDIVAQGSFPAMDRAIADIIDRAYETERDLTPDQLANVLLAECV